MNQNGEIFQLRKQVTQQENQIKQFQNEIEKTKQGCEIDQVENKKLYEMTQINLKLSQVIDEKEQKIHLLKHDLEVSQIKVDEIEKVNNNLLNKLNERYQIFQSQSEQFSKSLISSETLFSQNVENDYYQQQLQILQNKYDDILKENQILLNNSSQIEEYKNKVALLSLEVSRYHNLQKGSPSQNFIQSPRVENQVMINKISLNQEKESRIKTEHVFDNNYKDSDFYCLLVLLFAEIESLRTKLDEKKIEDRSQVQQIIEFYRPKAQ
ncbi:unnamed protein product [Paramecium sonneborni]|nr:unnamed protein product [Paramecium sonneborni]